MSARKEAHLLLDASKGQRLTLAERSVEAVRLAELMLKESPRGNRLQRTLARMLEDPEGRTFTTQLADQSFRSSNPSRIANQICYLLDRFGIPRFLSAIDRLALWAFRRLAPLSPKILVPLFTSMLRRHLSSVVIPAEEKGLLAYLRRREKEGVQVNLNHLGEAILGEEEAQRQLQLYLDDLRRPEISYVSVKISSICSQLDPLAWDTISPLLRSRLAMLYETANAHGHKFVNLDMESFHDLYLTLSVFCDTLDEPRFHSTYAGVVLQAYLPESATLQRKLTEWATRRVDQGGSPIKLRIVRGANLAAERVIAAQQGWVQAPYFTKAEVDANFKRMLTYACEPVHAQAVHVGVGSHNLLDVAYTLLLRSEKEVERYVTLEMLEGMAEPLRRVAQELAGGILLYAPIAHEKSFQTAVAYLIRRLDENAGPENFLRHLFSMKAGSQDWKEQVTRFIESCEQMDSVSVRSHRQQNRFVSQEPPLKDAPFVNESDTDWSLPHHIRWARQLVQEPLARKIAFKNWTEIDQGLKNSKPASDVSWEKVAEQFRSSRGELIRAMVFNTQKTVAEADKEVSEAIDFIEYYRRQMEQLKRFNELHFEPRGNLLVAPPWNFPCSIPTGAISAALISGNAVLFKPAPEALLVGWTVANCFWRGGVPSHALHFLPCRDEPEGSQLVQDHRVHGVLLTGGTATAEKLLSLRPDLYLMAETGGKNALIISNMADRDASINDLIRSSFGHAGQKCSAASLAIVHGELYDDTHFMQRLRDAASSLRVGLASDLSTQVPPLIRLPEEPLLSALTLLEPGEEWLLEPQQHPEHPTLWSPGIKIHVKPGSHSHMTEFFGPLLSVMRADSIAEAISLANAVPYGLTGGIHSLDRREIEQYLDLIEVGNAYVNRTITGAIVQRQPFGGVKSSSFGPGAKVGGPNFLPQLLRVTQICEPTDLAAPGEAAQRLLQAPLSESFRLMAEQSAASYSYWWSELSTPQDPSNVLGQINTVRYLPRQNIYLRAQGNDSELALLQVRLAVATCGATLQESGPEESEEAFISRLGIRPRVRLVSPPSQALVEAVAKRGGYLEWAPPLMTGRFELLRYTYEKSISWDIHRYGHIEELEKSVFKK